MNEKEVIRMGFLRLCSHDLNNARHVLQTMRRYLRADARYPMLRDVVISYGRPFSGSRAGSVTVGRLSRKDVSFSLRPLHDELLMLRNRLFAHSDYGFYKPKFANWSTDDRAWFPMSFKGFDYRSLDFRIGEIQALVEDVERGVLAQIEIIEDRARKQGMFKDVKMLRLS